MGVSLGWLAVALAASGPAAPSREAAPRITYRFQTVEVRGLSWREAGLKPVAQHGSVGVWTTGGDFLDRLASSSPKVDPATEAEGDSDRPVHVTNRSPREFVTRVVWKGREKTPRPVVEQVREGLTATVSGRRIDQGVLARIVVEDVDVRAVHAVSPARDDVKRASAETPAARCPFEAMKARERGDASVTVTVTATMDADEPGWRKGEPAPPKTDARAARAGWTPADGVKIPEVGRASAAGEWLIPDGEVLVVAFGPHTVADADGKAVVRERLAVIAAESVDAEEGDAAIQIGDDSDSAAPAPLDPEVHEIPPPAPPARTDVPRAAMAQPKLPARSLPRPVHPDGSPAPETVVPADEAHAAASAGDSAEPRPTPQSRRKAESDEKAPKAEPKPDEAPKTEPKAVKSSFSLPVLKNLPGLSSLDGLLSANLFGGPFQSIQFLVPLKPLALKLPFHRKLEFELVGRVVADPEGIGPFMAGN